VIGKPYLIKHFSRRTIWYIAKSFTEPLAQIMVP